MNQHKTVSYSHPQGLSILKRPLKGPDQVKFNAYIWKNSSKNRASALVIHSNGKMNINGQVKRVKKGEVYIVPIKPKKARNRSGICKIAVLFLLLSALLLLSL